VTARGGARRACRADHSPGGPVSAAAGRTSAPSSPSAAAPGPAPGLSLVACRASGCAHAACRRAAAAHERLTSPVPAAGTARRLRALAFMGHGAAALARRLEVPGRVVRRLQRGAPRAVPAALAARVAALYDDLWDVPGGSAAPAREAQRKNWCPPLGWDEDRPGDDGYAGHGIDDPGAVPAPGWRRPRRGRRLSADEQAAELADLVRLGLSLNQAALRLGLSGDTLKRVRERAAAAS
jgi:hypothetical protein